MIDGRGTIDPSASPDLGEGEPSASPTPEFEPIPSPTIPYDRSLGWYMERVEKFDPAPTPEPISIPKGGSTPWWSRVPTKQPVAFITIDDGGLARTYEAQQFIRRAKIPVTLFLNSPAALANPDYFKVIRETGAGIGDHTVTHRNLKGQSYAFQRKEIEDCANQLESVFGYRPYLFRPPFGDYDSNTLKAARDLGMQVSFFWSHTVDQGIIHYQTSEKVVKPGDIFLMHFRPMLADDLISTVNTIKKNGLIPARLEDYVPRPA